MLEAKVLMTCGSILFLKQNLLASVIGSSSGPTKRDAEALCPNSMTIYILLGCSGDYYMEGFCSFSKGSSLGDSCYSSSILSYILWCLLLLARLEYMIL